MELFMKKTMSFQQVKQLKEISIILMLFFSVSFVFSQEKQLLSVHYGIASNVSLMKAGIVGAASSEGKGAIAIGVNYQKFKSINSSYQIGLFYSNNKFETTPAFYPGIDMTPKKKEIKMLTLNFFKNYTFLTYAFVNGGFLLDIDMSKKDYAPIDNQSGIGLSLGVGGKFSYKDFEVTINPFINTHAILPFTSEDQQHIWEAGIKFGLGYFFKPTTSNK